MIKKHLSELVLDALKKLGIESAAAEITYPQHDDHGDFTTNVALKLAKQEKKSPLVLAKEIVELIKKSDPVEDVTVAAPGFINFTLSPEYLFGHTAGEKPKTKDSLTLVEYGDANTHKVPHVGHLFSYIFGESLARIIENQGERVVRLSYQGDVGLHVAKCLWAVSQADIKKVSDKPLAEKVEFLQESYQRGSEAYEKNETSKKEIDELNIKIYNHDSTVEQAWRETRSWSIDYYEQFEKRLGVVYDKYYFESQTSPTGKEIVMENVGKVFEESQGAVVFRGEKYDLHTRVFINKFGNPTYEAKDIGLIAMKQKDFVFNTSLVTTASEQSDYWKVIIKASELLYPNLVGKLIHLGFGMINLTSGKMSSRKGAIVNAFSLVDDVTEKIKKSYDIPDSLAAHIAMAAIKYSFLKSDAYKNIIFDIEKSIAREGDSGPYLLYTYVRAASVLEKTSLPKKFVFPKQVSKEERGLINRLLRYNDVVARARSEHLPHLVTQYLFDLAQSFNYFYQGHPILKAEGSTRDLRLKLTARVSDVIKSGLDLLGIETVEKM